MSSRSAIKLLSRPLPAHLLRGLLFLAGALFPLALAPFFYWPIGIISLAGMVLGAYQAQTPRAAFINIWCFAFGQFLTGVSWIYVSIHFFGGTPAPIAGLMVIVFAAFLAIFPALVFWLRQRFFAQRLAWLTVPAFWFLAEWLRGNFLTGFPWLFAGDAHLFTWLAGFAPIIGSYGISIILVLSLTASWQAWRNKQPVYLAVLLLWPLGAWLHNFNWTAPVGELKVSAVQGDVAQEQKWLPEMVSPTIRNYYQQSAKHWDSDLILWPETAITLIYDQFLPYLEDISSEAQEHGTTIMTGLPYRHPRGTPLAGEYHNSIVAFGNGGGLYHKQKLVPFGEFVPFEKQIRGLLPFFDLDMSSFLAGQPDQPLLKVNKGDDIFLVAPFICYEITYPQLVAQMAKQADLLVTISNDAWFGNSLGPKQHMALAQMRALETGRWLLRSTNTGTTALVNNKGQIVEQLPTNIRATLSGSAELRQGLTPYMRWGLWPVWATVITVLALAARPSRLA